MMKHGLPMDILTWMKGWPTLELSMIRVLNVSCLRVWLGNLHVNYGVENIKRTCMIASGTGSIARGYCVRMVD